MSKMIWTYLRWAVCGICRQLSDNGRSVSSPMPRFFLPFSRSGSRPVRLHVHGVLYRKTEYTGAGPRKRMAGQAKSSNEEVHEEGGRITGRNRVVGPRWGGNQTSPA